MMKEKLQKNLKKNFFYYYGEPVFFKDKKGFLVNMYKNEKSEIFAKIQVKNSILETRVKNSDIKEIIKKEIEDENINNQNNDEICSGCEIY